MSVVETKEVYDVLIVGGGPAGLSIGAELSKNHKVLLVEKGEIGHTARSWIVPGSIIAKLDKDVQQFAYNGVKRFLEYTPSMEIKWEAVAPWKSEEKWKCYPYIDQEGILNFWADKIRENGSTAIEKCAYIDYIEKDGIVSVKTVDSTDPSKAQIFKTRLLIDASGYSSEIVKKNMINREEFFWWSVYGYDIEFEDISKLKHPGNLGEMKVGDYMLWQSFKDVPMDPEVTLSQLRPIMEYEVLDEKKVFVFILYFCKNKIDKDFMKNQFDYILQNEDSIKSFREGKPAVERFGWYPSSGVSQTISKDNIAFVGDSGCWTIPAGWGMSFILNNYKVYAENLSKALISNDLSKKNLNKATQFNIRQKYEILMDKLVLHFLSYAKPEMIDRFTKCVFDHFGGERLEIMFCLQLNNKESLETLKVVLKEFHLKELMPIIKNEADFLLLLEIGKDFIESTVIDGIRHILGKKKEDAGFEYEGEE